MARCCAYKTKPAPCTEMLDWKNMSEQINLSEDIFDISKRGKKNLITQPMFDNTFSWFTFVTSTAVQCVVNWRRQDSWKIGWFLYTYQSSNISWPFKINKNLALFSTLDPTHHGEIISKEVAILISLHLYSVHGGYH